MVMPIQTQCLHDGGNSVCHWILGLVDSHPSQSTHPNQPFLGTILDALCTSIVELFDGQLHIIGQAASYFPPAFTPRPTSSSAMLSTTFLFTKSVLQPLTLSDQNVFPSSSSCPYHAPARPP